MQDQTPQPPAPQPPALPLGVGPQTGALSGQQLTHLILLEDLAAVVTRALADAGVRGIWLKGLALGDSCYAFGERWMMDVDLLVAHADRAATETVLRGLGLTPLPHQGRPLGKRAHPAWGWVDRRGAQLDLHVELVSALRWRPDLSGISARAVPLRIGGAAGWRPCDEDLLLLLALDQAKDDHQPKSNGRDDVARLLRRAALDWTAVVERAAQWRCETALWLVLRRAAAADGGQLVPPAVWRALAPRPWRAALLQRGLGLDHADGGRAAAWPRRRRQLVVGALTADRPLGFVGAAARFSLIRGVEQVIAAVGLTTR